METLNHPHIVIFIPKRIGITCQYYLKYWGMSGGCLDGAWWVSANPANPSNPCQSLPILANPFQSLPILVNLTRYF